MYHCGMLASCIFFCHSSLIPRPLRTYSMIWNDVSESSPQLIKSVMMLSRQPITLAMVALPSLINSSAFPNQTSVPWDRPEICSSCEKFAGLVCSSIPLTNLVPNSGIPKVPVFDWIWSWVTPIVSVPENNPMTPGSSIGID